MMESSMNKSVFFPTTQYLMYGTKQVLKKTKQVLKNIFVE